jgi:hypothetical protein
MHEGARAAKACRRRGARLALFSAGAAAFVALGLGCGPEASAPPSPPAASPPASPPAELVATHADFEGFQRWERIALESATVPTKARPGPAAVYVNRRAPAGATSWPVGTILVKAIESGPDPRDWTVHAMVKRGATFNPTGAVGWEFFGLQLTAEGRPVILWRSEGDNDGHSYSAGLSIAGPVGTPPGAELTCIDCHAAAWQDDDVLTPALSLRAR